MLTSSTRAGKNCYGKLFKCLLLVVFIVFNSFYLNKIQLLPLESTQTLCFKVFVAKIILAVSVFNTFFDLFNNYYTMNFDEN